MWRPDLQGVRDEIAAIVRAVSRFEPVTLLVNPSDAENARKSLGDISDLDIFEVPVDEIYVRDGRFSRSMQHLLF